MMRETAGRVLFRGVVPLLLLLRVQSAAAQADTCTTPTLSSGVLVMKAFTSEAYKSARANLRIEETSTNRIEQYSPEYPPATCASLKAALKHWPYLNKKSELHYFRVGLYEVVTAEDPKEDQKAAKGSKSDRRAPGVAILRDSKIVGTITVL